MYYNAALTTNTTDTLFLVWSHCKLFYRNAKRDFPTRDSHLYKCLILKASFVFEFSLTPDGHDYRGMSSGHTDVLSKITYYILLHGWGIK